tara:strand:- start:3169 stop:4005 length:837 start_codon:yes stop_codon:yes gene_type:complete
MTAYVSTNHNYKGCSISCDIKSVNGKSLDINFKSNFILPEVELFLRDLVSKKVHRGNIEINFNVESIGQPSFVLNKKLIKEIKEELNKSDLDIKNLNFSDIKDIPNIFIDKKKSAYSETFIKRVFKGAFIALIENKEIEGHKIKKTFADRIKKIHKNLISLTNEEAKNKYKREKNVLNKLNSSSFVVSDESISNEVVNQIIKSDISEEIDRLKFHKSSLLEELESKNAKGKKIDFILLEMLREVNTILAKVTFSKEKKYALDIKIYIEEMREQVSNVE